MGYGFLVQIGENWRKIDDGDTETALLDTIPSSRESTRTPVQWQLLLQATGRT